WLDLIDLLERFAHLRAHANQNAEQGGARVVQTGVAHEQMSARLRGGRNEPERRRGNISGNEEIARFGSLIAENTDAAVVVFTHRADEITIQHQLGMIAA